MTVAQTLRRLHLYFGLLLLPWILMYGVSSFCLAHSNIFNRWDAAKGRPMWTVLEERDYAVPVPADQEGLRQFGRTLVQELGIERPNLGVYRVNARTLHVISHSFLETIRATVAIDEKKVTVEKRRFRWEQFLAGLHVRGGFAQDGLMADAWAVVVDIVCAAFLLFIATGYYMWWRIGPHRNWGWLAILSGAGAFLGFTLGL